MKINNLVTPSPEIFNVVIHGMRNAFESYDKSDSVLIDVIPVDSRVEFDINEEGVTEKEALKYFNNSNFSTLTYCECESHYMLGEKDKQLLLNLCRAGDPSHRKVLRQLPVVMDITAPLYWFKQFDTYKIGTTANSTSTMHCLTKEPFKLEDFSVEHYRSIFGSKTKDQLDAFELLIVSDLNDLRDKYLETKDMKFWYAINEILPQSYNQTRTWSANYEVLLTIIKQRRNHKLPEWTEFIDYLLDNVPYLKEIVEAIDGRKS